MNIKTLELKNFGRFSRKELAFDDGINVICGRNGSGKTTIYMAIMALLFGMERQRGRASKSDSYTTYQPWENKTWYEGVLHFETGGKLFRLERNFYQGEKSARLVCVTDGEELSVEQGDLEVLLGIENMDLFVNTAAVGQLKMKPQKSIYDYLKNYIANSLEGGSDTTDVVKTLAILDQKRKTLEQEKKKRIHAIQSLISQKEAGKELVEKEIYKYQEKLEGFERQKEELKRPEEKWARGFWKRLLQWLKRLFFRKAISEEKKKYQDELVKVEEKILLQRELLGEKESLLEELLLEIESLYGKMQECTLNEEGKAIEFAAERIRTISAQGSTLVWDKLQKKASRVLAELTDGAYEKIILEDGKEISVWDGQRKLQMFQISTGTVDQVDLAFRIALQDLFFAEDPLPLIFDDAFIYFDDERLGHLLSYLGSMNRQVLIFSCHQRETEILEKKGIRYQKIVIG